MSKSDDTAICPHCGAENVRHPDVDRCRRCAALLDDSVRPPTIDLPPALAFSAESRTATAAAVDESAPAGPAEAPSWRDDLAALIVQGQRIPAIKLYREHTGAGLKEAKEAVEALASGQTHSPEPAADPAQDAEIMRLLQRGEKIQAIKRYRELTPAGLREAKEAVEAMEVAAGPPAGTVDASVEEEIGALLEQGQWIPAIKLYREHTGASLKVAKYAVMARARERGIPEPAGAGCLGAVFLGLALVLAAVVTQAG